MVWCRLSISGGLRALILPILSRDNYIREPGHRKSCSVSRVDYSAVRLEFMVSESHIGGLR